MVEYDEGEQVNDVSSFPMDESKVRRLKPGTLFHRRDAHLCGTGVCVRSDDDNSPFLCLTTGKLGTARDLDLSVNILGYAEVRRKQ